MHKHVQKTIRKLKKSFNHLLNRVIFLIKLIFVLIIVFFTVLVLIIKPNYSGINNHFFDPEHSAALPKDAQRMDFIESIIPYAKKAQKKYGVKPSVLVAQAALESNWGNSGLAKEAKNYFGIKGSKEDAEYATREFSQDKWIEINASFKRYSSMEESVMDYAKLLQHGTSWNKDLYKSAIDAETYKEAALAVQEAGYATDPDYAKKLIRIIEQYSLYELDK